MSKHYFFIRSYFALLIITLCISFIYAQSDTNVEKGLSDAKSLEKYAIPISSINPIDDDFSDLKPLVKKIGKAKVVVLGEATHSEGSTSAAKSRMVRFLHKEMGFDVLAWESGLFQTLAMNSALRDADIPLKRAKYNLMLGGWANEKQTNNLFEYIRASWKTDRPLEMSGFDAGKPHASARFFKKFFEDLGKRNSLLSINEEDWKRIKSLQSRGYGFISNKKVAEDVRVSERQVLETLTKIIKTNHDKLLKTFSKKELKLADRFIYDSLVSEELRHILKTKGGEAWNIARDKFMADTFLWSMKNLYPNRKIIIWAATAHLIRNGDSIENIKNEGWYKTSHHMGHKIYPELGKDLYTIAFTSYEGESGEVFPKDSKISSQVKKLKSPPENSFEAIAHKLNNPYLFVNLRSVNDKHWLRGKFISVALGKLENKASWSNIIDAFFFIDKAKPVEYMPN